MLMVKCLAVGLVLIVVGAIVEHVVDVIQRKIDEKKLLKKFLENK